MCYVSIALNHGVGRRFTNFHYYYSLEKAIRDTFNGKDRSKKIESMTEDVDSVLTYGRFRSADARTNK